MAAGLPVVRVSGKIFSFCIAFYFRVIWDKNFGTIIYKNQFCLRALIDNNYTCHWFWLDAKLVIHKTRISLWHCSLCSGMPRPLHWCHLCLVMTLIITAALRLLVSELSMMTSDMKTGTRWSLHSSPHSDPLVRTRGGKSTCKFCIYSVDRVR